MKFSFARSAVPVREKQRSAFFRRRFLAGALVFWEKAERDEWEPEYRHAEQDGNVLMKMFLLCRTICRDEKDGEAAGEQADGTKNAVR